VGRTVTVKRGVQNVGRGARPRVGSRKGHGHGARGRFVQRLLLLPRRARRVPCSSGARARDGSKVGARVCEGDARRLRKHRHRSRTSATCAATAAAAVWPSCRRSRGGSGARKQRGRGRRASGADRGALGSALFARVRRSCNRCLGAREEAFGGEDRVQPARARRSAGSDLLGPLPETRLFARKLGAPHGGARARRRASDRRSADTEGVCAGGSSGKQSVRGGGGRRRRGEGQRSARAAEGSGRDDSRRRSRGERVQHGRRLLRGALVRRRVLRLRLQSGVSFARVLRVQRVDGQLRRSFLGLVSNNIGRTTGK
jgi:hypothetical protein